MCTAGRSSVVEETGVARTKITFAGVCSGSELCKRILGQVGHITAFTTFDWDNRDLEENQKKWFNLTSNDCAPDKSDCEFSFSIPVPFDVYMSKPEKYYIIEGEGFAVK